MNINQFLSPPSPPPCVPMTDRKRRNAHIPLVMEPDIERRLRRFFAPHNTHLYALVGRNLGWDDGDGGGGVEEGLAEASSR